MIELIECDKWGESSMSRRAYVVDTDLPVRTGIPVIVGSSDPEQSNLAGWRYMPEYKWWENISYAMNIIKPVIVIFK